MADNLVDSLVPHQGCVITRNSDAVEIAGSAMNWVLWEIGLDRMRVLVDGEVRFEGQGDYRGIESAPSVGPCFGSAVTIREFSVTPL